jgi:hypothetical protein
MATKSRFINWVNHARASVLWRLARFGEAIVEFQRALKTEKRDHISQRVNLAEHYIWLNKPELALKTQEPARWQANWLRLLDRPDVKAAIARAGRDYQRDLPAQ